jgi:hypothetical protein
LIIFSADLRSQPYIKPVFHCLPHIVSIKE